MDRRQAFAQDIIKLDGIDEAHALIAMPKQFDRYNKVRCIGHGGMIAQGQTFYHQHGKIVICEKCREALVEAVQACQ